jgi:Na+/melibiose symporter-like transporter
MIDDMASVRPDPNLGSAPALDPIANVRNPDHYKVGTLTYTKAGLVALFFYLLWGDFCFQIMETIMPNLLPLELNRLGASNWTIGLLITTIPGLITFFVNPVVSFRSDRFRSRWGRRIPFLAAATPFVAVFLALLGFAEPIGRSIHHLALAGRFSELTVVLLTMGVLMVCFQFFNSFINTTYYYLFNDVVPPAFLARMMSLGRTVSGVSSISYSAFVFPHSEGHMPQILLGAALIYLLGFAFMCWKVREGRYPPVPENVDHRQGFIAAVKTYATECFTHRFYWLIFIANCFWAMTWLTGPFGNLLMTKVMGFDRAFIGELGAITGAVTIILLYPAGILADRFHPLRVMLVALALGLLLSPVTLILTFVRPHVTLGVAEHVSMIMSVIGSPLGALASASEAALFMRLLPRDRYGQFASANALVRSVALIVGGLAVGAFLDFMKRFDPNPDLCYRFVPVWNVVFQSGYVFFYYLVYREWQRLGGLAHFVPPGGVTSEEIAPQDGGPREIACGIS